MTGCVSVIPSHWNVFPDAAGAVSAVTERIIELGGASVRRNGRFTLVLSGGRTPMGVYRQLNEINLDYSHWHLFFGDERCLPEGYSDTNSEAAIRAWLGNGSVPTGNVHRMRAELGADKAAEAYGALIRPWQPFDVALLGMGEDGHVASLFPGDKHDESRLVVPVRDAPKPPAERISLGYGTLASARSRLLLITGKAKRSAVRLWLSGHDLPVSRLASCAELDVFLDEAALPD